MKNMSVTYLGSVNRWECDENDHLNVRFYYQKSYQALVAGLLDNALVAADAIASACRSNVVTHMRFVAEARVAVPITGYFGLVAVSDGGFSVLIELRNTITNDVLSAFTYQIEYPLSVGSSAMTSAKLAFAGDVSIAGDASIVGQKLQLTQLPDHAGSRGLQAEPLQYANISRKQAYELGFVCVGRGVVQTDECCSEGFLLPYLYIGRSSDSMPNLWAMLDKDNTRGEGELGGAVLEYRMNHFNPLMLGNRFEMVSGVQSIGRKTQIMAHLLFNLETEQMVIGSNVVGVNMDLVARKAIEIPADRRRFIERHLLQSVAQ
ncbi:MAG: hypothetical protein KUG79_01725 [Pseudomonadales bacterium]|nr:hypothetical protein [Pseudomonadales bacterium]